MPGVGSSEYAATSDDLPSFGEESTTGAAGRGHACATAKKAQIEAQIAWTERAWRFTPRAMLLRTCLLTAFVALWGCSADVEAPADEDTSEEGLTGDRRIDPIEVGHAWTYDVRVLGWYPACADGIHTATALEKVHVGGRDGIRVQSLCARAGTFVYAVDGDSVASWWGGAWRNSLDAPVRSGKVWSDDFAEYTWERVASIDTPAGKFRTCWSATKRASYDSYTIFCRGVGPVKWHYEDGWGNGYDAVLVSKNF